MQPEHIAALAATFDRFPERGVCVVDGYGIKIRVDKRHLVVSDGVGTHRREARFHKATHKLNRLVILGHTGYITLEAVRWLTETGIGIIHLDANGRLLTTSTDLGLNHPALRRAQAMAASIPIGVVLAQQILDRKLHGQADNARQLHALDIADQIQESQDRLTHATTLNELLIIEAGAANLYWSTWTDISVEYPKSDLHKIPDHWLTFGARGSGLGSGARLATNPANALLNYLYALLEGEATIACATVGLDPGIGILHADQKARDSIALDIMEAIRPNVDAYLLDLLQSHRFKRSDFHETRRGDCRILPPLTHVLASTTRDWKKQLAPVVEDVARRLLSDASTNRESRLPTPLTESKRSQGRPRSQTANRKTRNGISRPSTHACLDCGKEISTKNKRCGDCDHRFQAERLTRQGREARQALSEAGRDPNKTPEARKAVGEANRRHRRANAQWKSNGRPISSEYFRNSVLPMIRNTPLVLLTESTGLSVGYIRLIRNGQRIPHPRHWVALEGAASRMDVGQG